MKTNSANFSPKIIAKNKNAFSEAFLFCANESNQLLISFLPAQAISNVAQAISGKNTSDKAP